MSVALCIDHREHALIARFQEQESVLSYPIHVRSLPIGDLGVYHVKGNADPNTDPDGIAIMLFERKTVADLAASIKDGRYREQVTRIQASGIPPWRVIYIVEGIGSIGDIPEEGTVHGIAGRALCSVLLALQFRHGFHVWYSVSTGRTMYLINRTCARLAKEPTKWETPAGVGAGAGTRGGAAAGGHSYIDCVKAKVEKKDNITPEVCYQLQLCQIPGVSTKLARAISQRYGTMAELVLELHTAGRDDACKALQEVPLLGPKKAHTIYEFLCGGA